MKIIIGLFVFFSLSSARAETLAQVRNRIDTWLTNKIVNIVIPKQNNYAANHGGNFWQGLISHSIIPAHTAGTAGDSTGDRFTLHPTDQNSSWIDAVPDFTGETWPSAAVIDVFEGPLGKGWVATLYVMYNGIIYQRTKGFGPGGSSYDRAWTVVGVEP